MKARTFLTVFILVNFSQVTWAETKVKIAKASGEVKIRRGVEETWHPASAGTRLDEIDSILTGEGASVVLETPDGKTFELGSNSILDIADLRRISERELFLFLMSKKINQIEPRQEKTKLRIGNVNVVHGELKSNPQNTGNSVNELWVFEKNGAKALFAHDYTTNAVLKLNKILRKYPNLNDCGEIHSYLGKGFEKLNKPGQAIDAYQTAIKRSAETCSSNSKLWLNEAESALKRLNR